MKLITFLEATNKRNIFIESPAGFVTSPRNNKKFQVYLNPSLQEIQKLNGELRAYLVGDIIYGWGITKGIHRDVQHQLHLPNDAIPIYLYTDGKEAHIVVTDAVPDEWEHNPAVANKIRDNGYLQQFNSIEIDYYDSDIVGDWEQTMEETVGSNAGEINSEDDTPRPPPQHGDEEGNAGWEWTDPTHSSGAENAVMSRTP